MSDIRSARLERTPILKRSGGASSLPQLPTLSRRAEDSPLPLVASSVFLPPITKSGAASTRASLLESQTPVPSRVPLVSPLSSRASRRTFSNFGGKAVIRQSLFLDAPSPGTIRDVASISKPGLVDESPKAQNQDAILTVKNLADQSDLSLYCVFDGHGTYGHDISSFLRDNLATYLIQSLTDIQSPSPETYAEALKATFRTANISLRKASVDYTYSGSTAIVVLLKGALCLCANVGDSRAVLGRKSLAEWRPVAISVDHKPNVAEESSRVLAAGGKIAAFYNNAGAHGGPLRVWLKNQRIPGLAMTRSIGDAIAARIGVSSEPQLHQMFLTSQEKFLILASDGLWEMLSSEEVVSIAGRYYESNTCIRCAEGLVREATERWRKASLSCDDISVTVVFFA